MAKLTKWGGGRQEEELPRRERMIRKLSYWLESTNDIEVYTPKKKGYAHGTFSSNSKHQPDLIASDKSKHYLIKYTGAENSRDVHDTAIRVKNYWQSIATGADTYSVNGAEVEIEAVLIATNYSPLGRLFSNKQNNDPLRTGRSDGAEDAAAKGFLPKTEHTCSESLIRMVWRFAEENIPEGSCGIGALYSSRLDERNPETGITEVSDKHTTKYTPAACYKIPGTSKSQRWMYLPNYKKNQK